MIRIFEADEILEMIKERIAKDISSPFNVTSVQIQVEQPFGSGMKVHNEVPGLFIHFSIGLPHHKKSMYPNGRQEAVDRLDAMIDSFDHCSGIDRSPQHWWKNQDG